MAVAMGEAPRFDYEAVAESIDRLCKLSPGKEADEIALDLAYRVGHLGGEVDGLKAQVAGLEEEIERLKDELLWRSS